MASNSLGTTTISLLSNSKLQKISRYFHGRFLAWETNLDTFAFRQRNPWLLTSNDKNVGLARGKRVVYGILDVYNIEASVMALPMRDHTHTTHITPASSHGNDASIEANEFSDFPVLKTDLDGIVDLDRWVRIPNPNITNFVSTSPKECIRNLVQRLNDSSKLTSARRA